MNLFDKTNSIGKQGEQKVIEYYQNKGVEVIDVSNDAEYQKKDIDVLLNGQPVEIKTGQNIQRYNDLIVEIISNANKDYFKEGWFLTTEADILIYYSPGENKMYQISTDGLRQYYNENIDNIQTKTIYKNEFNNIIKPSVIAFLPIEEIKANVQTYREVYIEE